MMIDERARRARAGVSKRLIKVTLIAGMASFCAACSTYTAEGPRAYLTDPSDNYAAASIRYDGAGNEVASAETYVNPRDTSGASWGRYSGAAGQDGSSAHERYVYRGKQALGGPR